MIVWEQRLEDLEFVNTVLGVTFIPSETAWLASVDSTGKRLGVVVYNRFSKHNCEMSVAAASARFLSKQNLKAFFGYPFYQCQLRRVTAVVEADNKRSLEFCRRLGFVEEGVLRKWFGDQDGIVLGLLKEECRWL